MKSIVLFIAIAFSIAGQAQSKYEQGMRKAFDLWEAEKLDEASNLFERIATAEKDNWLPDYYVAQIQVLKSWDLKDEAVLKAQLDKAQEYVNNIKTKDGENVYALQMQSQIYTAWIAYDGMKYGMKYAGLVGQMYAKAVQMEPKNPMLVLSKAEWDMGSAKYFGTPLDPYCEDVRRAEKLFTTFKPETEFHPSYGVERIADVLKQCNK